MVALVGPTASGKSAIAAAAALASFSLPSAAELVSVDSMAVYRGMDVGTAKPSATIRARVRVHLVDLLDPGEEFTVQRFQAEAGHALEGIAARRHSALLVGGTGLYLRSVVDALTFPGRYPELAAELLSSVETAGPEGSRERAEVLHGLHARLHRLDPAAAARIAPTNVRRLVRALEVTIGSGRAFSSYGPGLERYPPTPVTMLGLRTERAELDSRIAGRFEQMMADGLLAEVERLAARPGGLSRTARQALGYRELLNHLDGELSVGEAVDRAISRTQAFARRQMAWFRRDPRIVWLDHRDDPVGVVLAHLADAGPRAGPVGDWIGDNEPVTA